MKKQTDFERVLMNIAVDTTGSIKKGHKYIGLIWLLVALLNLPSAFFISKISIIVVVLVLDLLIVEIYLGPIRKLLIFIHTEAYFYKAARERREKYLSFRQSIKSGSGNFEQHARDVIK